MPEDWHSIARQKQKQRSDRIPAEWRLKTPPAADVLNVMEIPRTCGILTAKEIEITENYDATALGAAIAFKKLTCIEVTTAFCKRAAIAQQVTNCLTEIYFEEAIARAEALDYCLATTGKTLGSLHGVPVSLKDTFRISGTDASIGIAAFAFEPSMSTSPLVVSLLKAGAVIYCKTNVPQTLMALDSDNNVFGRTLNPINKLVTAGGSSGGEGALLAMRGSVLGVGTDIGGSIRIPAMCNGIYGLKPSPGRVPFAGKRSPGLPGSEALGLKSSAGPMAQSLRDLELFMKVVSDDKPWETDPALVPGFWDSMDCRTFQDSKKPMTIGVLHTDNLITPLPPIKNLLIEVSESLTRAGHRVVNIPTPSGLKDAQSLANGMFDVTGGDYILDQLERHGEPLTTWLTARLKRKRALTVDQARKLHAARSDLMTSMLSMWKYNDGRSYADVDAIICPVAPHPVPPIDRWNGVSYTSSMVLFDYAAGTVPVRAFTEKDLQGELDEGAPLSSWDKANRGLWEKDKIDRRVYLGTPLCVQVVAPKLQEKRLYKAMEAVSHAVHAYAGKGNRARL